MAQRTKKLCSIDGCENAHLARGYCSKHYQKKRRLGDPLAGISERTYVTSVCSVEGCQKKYLARGLCPKHYSALRRNGDPQKNNHRFQTPEEAFIARTSWDRGCLIWNGSRGSGYGNIWVNGALMRAHRYAWERVNGPIPDGVALDHICHRPPCVNVDHLRLATAGQNSSHRSGPDRKNVSGYRNVYRNKKNWKVVVSKNGKKHYFGTFSDIKEAAEVAERARRDLFGEFAGKG